MLLAQLAPWQSPTVDYHALAPEIILAGAIVVLLVADLFLPERQKWATSTIAVSAASKFWLTCCER